ncbi:hypothetical protein BJ912DRAFT_1142515 [Pholiota molesta]|nr:hypothetical protein BJ912DRAFT_1142515 [Pholiota molesta]
MFTAPTALPRTNDEGRGGESKGRPGSGRPTRYAPLRIPPSFATDHDPYPQPPCMPTTCYGQPPPLATCPPATSCHVTRPRRPAAALAHNSNGPAPPAPSSRGGPAPLATSCRGARTRHRAATPTHDDGSIRTRLPPPATSSRGARHDNHGSPPTISPRGACTPRAYHVTRDIVPRRPHTHNDHGPAPCPACALRAPQVGYPCPCPCTVCVYKGAAHKAAPAAQRRIKGGLSEGTCGYTCEYPSGSADDGYTSQAPEPPRAPTTAVDQEVESLLENLSPSKKRARPNDEGSDDESGGYESDGGGESNKKQKLFERDMPWFQRELTARKISDPSCTETRQILSLLGNDVSTVKRWIQQSSTAPLGFPSSEWENIIRGNAIDLDKVFSALHLVAPTKENVGRVGSTTISLGDTEPLRRIQTSGDWFAAWREAAKATAFVFPHRRDELWDYGDYIGREFSAKTPSAHRKIILYDAAVRNMVGGGQSILLTDRYKFDHIYSAIIPADGIQSDVGRSGASTSRNGSRARGSDICKRFNAFYCPDGSSCKYKHICKLVI